MVRKQCFFFALKKQRKRNFAGESWGNFAYINFSFCKPALKVF